MSGDETLALSIRGRGPVNYAAVMVLGSAAHHIQDLVVEGTLDGSGRFSLQNRTDNEGTPVRPFELRGQLGPTGSVIVGTSDRHGCPRFVLRRDGPSR